jgi:GT2 family glycosyltransferase
MIGANRLKTSIILVVFNGLGYLESCLNSVMPEISPEVELILVDNASSDGSADFVQQRWPQARLIRNAINRGFAAASNQGAGQAAGDILVFLNQDTRVLPGWLAGLSVPLEQEPGIGLVTSKLLLMSRPEQIQMCGQDIHFTGFTFGRGFLCPSSEYSQPEAVSAVAGASFAIRRRLWEQLGGFDESLFMYYEETDLCWRARLAGFTSVYNPGSVIQHDFSLNSSPTAIYYTVRNRLVMLAKNWKWVTLLLLVPSLVLSELVDCGYMLALGRQGLSAKLRAYVWLVAHFPAVLRARRSVQKTRRDPDWKLLQSCTATLAPRLITGGSIGRSAIEICNILFSIWYKLVSFLARKWNL